MKRMYALLSAIMMAAAIALPSRAETKMAFQPVAQDTLIMKLKNNSQVLVVVKDLKDLKSIKAMNLDSLVSLLDKHTTEIERAGSSASDQPVTITVDGGNKNQDVNITITQDTKDGRQVIKKEIKNVKIDVSVEGDEDESKLKVNVGKDDDDDDDEEKIKIRNPKSEYDFQIDLGVSGWANRKIDGGADGLNDVELDLTGSRFVALNSKWMYRLGNENSPLRLHTGFTFDFHNYMFEDNLMLVDNGELAAFVKADPLSLEKSKLATTTFTVPLELALDFRNSNGKSNFRIGAGGFAGYMIGSHTKIKYSRDGDTKKDKVKDDFYLEDFQYGLSGFIGIRSLELFAKYNLSDMFENNRGMQGNSFAIGARIMRF
ncbi:outer membrane beta-barrel protein [Nibribacter koreensis]|uniref:Outer membrane protein beta-barrel domain-containing protein n=1 Tax=Nibribacter koreensis TaxID=1084519 RepID=A0ABP8F9M7_9BACT